MDRGIEKTILHGGSNKRGGEKPLLHAFPLRRGKGWEPGRLNAGSGMKYAKKGETIGKSQQEEILVKWKKKQNILVTQFNRGGQTGRCMAK